MGLWKSVWFVSEGIYFRWLAGERVDIIVLFLFLSALNDRRDNNKWNCLGRYQGVPTRVISSGRQPIYHRRRSYPNRGSGHRGILAHNRGSGRGGTTWEQILSRRVYLNSRGVKRIIFSATGTRLAYFIIIFIALDAQTAGPFVYVYWLKP